MTAPIPDPMCNERGVPESECPPHCAHSVTAPTPEQRATWRRDFSHPSTECDWDERTHLALLDALDAAEEEARLWRRWATAAAHDFDNMADRVTELWMDWKKRGEYGDASLLILARELQSAIAGDVE